MSSSKYALAERAIGLLYPIATDENKTTIREMMYSIEVARDTVVRGALLSSLRAEEYYDKLTYVKGYGHSESLIAEYNEDMCMDVLELPARPIELPKQHGINVVRFLKGQDTMFTPVPSSYTALTRNNTDGLLKGEYGYWYANGKLHFPKRLPEGAELYVELIPRGRDIESYDEVFCPAGLEDNVITRAVEIHSVERQIKPDMVNNNIGE